ncbi:membrane protein [Terrihabitans soli]|uniref:Membrane protein n=1 Tax=Terrihabitans soli TaxID=708113 RepID=A0A6S6QWJ3_9HYPH|nr:AzlD domain-containing protein [Terrihabitans soli]BCJ91400.1 membrane protein [Terrihabitans soli]
MTLSPDNLIAILAMAAATYGARLTGLWVAAYIPAEGRLRAALDALPAAVLTAVVAPMALATGPAETLAAIVTILAATRLPLLATVATGVLAVVLFRFLLG